MISRVFHWNTRRETPYYLNAHWGRLCASQLLLSTPGPLIGPIDPLQRPVGPVYVLVKHADAKRVAQGQPGQLLTICPVPVAVADPVQLGVCPEKLLGDVTQGQAVDPVVNACYEGGVIGAVQSYTANLVEPPIRVVKITWRWEKRLTHSTTVW